MKTMVDRCQLSRFIWQWHKPINRQLSMLFCVLAIALSGCVQYDTCINFYGFNNGEIVQHIQLSDRLSSFNPQAVTDWLTSIEQRTIQAQGRLDRLSDREFEIAIPFASTQELVTKINRFFNTTPAATSGTSPQFSARLQIEQSNWLAIVKNHLTYDLDLRAISIPKSDTKVAIAANNFVDLKFRIQSPWGTSNSDLNTSPNIVKTTNGSQTIWQLQPGQLNRIDTVFWLPNPLGIGAIVISLISMLGYYLKYRQLPGQQNTRLVNPVETR
ncbi:DUF3153 domain-containing protein [Chamaesiphon sp. VAR_69_metabat_338]|uniref:DUF3153 domain-containing protein n=1 Tax=Chamaesiphon sp. VAR_69_metabat_338 TaxID=2964704 RepID=UPI00286D91B8|nr:DUF3153 domain-containing protein [Chamaesiphon sp. VAR_69_metabat_338]